MIVRSFCKLPEGAYVPTTYVEISETALGLQRRLMNHVFGQKPQVAADTLAAVQAGLQKICAGMQTRYGVRPFLAVHIYENEELIAVVTESDQLSKL